MRLGLHSHWAPEDLVPRHRHKIVLCSDTGLVSKYIVRTRAMCPNIVVYSLKKCCVHISDIQESFFNSECKHCLRGMLLTFRVTAKKQVSKLSQQADIKSSFFLYRLQCAHI